MITKVKMWEKRTWALVFDNSYTSLDGEIEIDCHHLIKEMQPLDATLHCNCGEDHPLEVRHCVICDGFWLDVTDLWPLPERFHGDMKPVPRGTGQ